MERWVDAGCELVVVGFGTWTVLYHPGCRRGTADDPAPRCDRGQVAARDAVVALGSVPYRERAMDVRCWPRPS